MVMKFSSEYPAKVYTRFCFYITHYPTLHPILAASSVFFFTAHISSKRFFMWYGIFCRVVAEHVDYFPNRSNMSQYSEVRRRLETSNYYQANSSRFYANFSTLLDFI